MHDMLLRCNAAMQGFEPYVLVSKTKVPWYDERFTGYLGNKILHTQTMVYWGFGFAVHPNVFLVHYPHSDSNHQTLVKSTGLQQEVTDIFWTPSVAVAKVPPLLPPPAKLSKML